MKIENVDSKNSDIPETMSSAITELINETLILKR